MTPEDRALARDLLLKNALTIEQVTELQQECDRTGRSFSQVAAARGLLKPAPAAAPPAPAPPPPPMPAPAVIRSPEDARLFQRLMIGTISFLLLLIVVSVLRYAKRQERDRQLAEESVRSDVEADQRAKAVAIEYSRAQLARKEQESRAALDRARGLMKLAEDRLKTDPSDPQIHLQVVEATVQFNGYLAAKDGDAEVLLERSRAYEIRRDFERAIADVDRAIELKKELAPAVDARLQQLRLQLARPKK